MDKKPDVLSLALSRCRAGFGAVALFSLAINLLMLAGPLYMLAVYDRVLNSGSVETLILLTLAVGVAIAAMAALETLRTSMTVRLGAWLTEALGTPYLLSGIQARLAGRSAGSQAFRDLAQLQGFIATQGLTAFFDSPWTPLFILIIWLLHPWLGMMALAVALLLLCLSVVNEIGTRQLLARANTSQIDAHRIAEAAIGNAEVVRAMGMEPALIQRWRMANSSIQGDLLRASERSGIVTGLSKFIRLFAQSGILGLGAFLVIRGETSPGVTIAASIMLGRALAPVDMAMTAWKNFSSARLAYGRLREQAGAFPVPHRRMTLPAPKGRLIVKDLTARQSGRTVLRAVSFEAQPGEAIAVIGPSGAGKSTLCRYLVGLEAPLTGSVRLDGNMIGHWNADELGPHIGFLPQEVGLFAGSIRENISRMAAVSDNQVIEAARLAQAHDMIIQMPEGYETKIGPNGNGLSGGQKQRIGLARAVLGSPALIVLDEPNANLDQAGERALSAAVAELKERGSTLLIIGHRPSTLAQSDKILVLNQGSVQLFGPRAEVLDQLRRETAARADKNQIKEADMSTEVNAVRLFSNRDPIRSKEDRHAMSREET